MNKQSLTAISSDPEQSSTRGKTVSLLEINWLRSLYDDPLDFTHLMKTGGIQIGGQNLKFCLAKVVTVLLGHECVVKN